MIKKTFKKIVSTIVASGLSSGAAATAASSEASLTQKSVEVPCDVRALPGALDQVLMVNSNSPEIVEKEGILVSTFPPAGMDKPECHLNLLLEGQFNIFAHHINRNATGEPKTLFIAALLHNPGKKKIRVRVLKAASYVSQPDAPFIKLADAVENPEGNVYAGPGDRVMDDILRGKLQAGWKHSLIVAPGQSKLLFNLPIEVRPIKPALNGRSTLVRLRTTGPLHVATLALFARNDSEKNERPPTLEEWQELLRTGDFAGPRDKVPTPPGLGGTFIYGRVAGVQRGSTWHEVLTDNATTKPQLRIPEPGYAFAYPISTVDHGTFGTMQIQSAPLVVRYPDTAYAAHGNYGVEYKLTLPLYNQGDEMRTVNVTLDTPVKTNEKKEFLSFFEPPPTNVFFRGTVEMKYKDDRGSSQHRYLHLVERRGQRGQPLLTVTMKPGAHRTVTLRFLYPPDATPPQALVLATEALSK